ncbi:hypothetical protein [Eubacterium ramulus]|mgnify:FL=1|jgi:hypothetical protein|nr:MAG TPA_asm: hypothetical protein [Bacteriophage sp.]DAO46235.1 MAG TPA: hypothetical protein [Bacteriophage sp.]
MQKFNQKEGDNVFSDEILEKIFNRKEMQRLDLQTQSSVIHAIEEVLEGEKQNADEQPVSE